MSNKKQKKHKKHRVLWFFIKLQIFLILVVVGTIIYYYAGGYSKKISALHDEAVELVLKSNRNTFKKNQTSIAYDAKNRPISVMKNSKNIYYLSYNDIPENVKLAILSVEDKKFYKHHGVDYKAIIRAAWAMLRNGEIKQGGSTITQQLARNVFLNNDKTWQRKIEEIYIAVELEKKYSKNDILEFYLNNIYFANGYYGVQAASQGYFSKSVDELDLSQTAFLMAIPNRPNLYDPILHKNNTIKRRNRILKSMYLDNIIKSKEYATAKAEDIGLKKNVDVSHDYMETFMRKCATEALMEADGFVFKNQFYTAEDEKEYKDEYKKSYAKNNKKLYTGGYRIYTSLDMDVQNKFQEILDGALARNLSKNKDGVFELQSAGVCIDNSTGMVKAIIGGRSSEHTGYTLNRAFQSFRQPGSTIKPLLVYTPMIERGYTADSDVIDEAIPDGPKNADGVFSGHMTLRRAVELSKNTVAWKLFEELTPYKGLNYLYKLGFEKISSKDAVMAASIGGLTDGVSPLEMAKGFAAIENDGNMRKSTCINQITTAGGKLIYQNKQAETNVYNVDAARQMTDILKGVMIRGTGAGYALSVMPCAGKTGTTNDNKDGWFVGYTKYYTTSVWTGYDRPRPMDLSRGDSFPLRIWHDFMEYMNQGLEPLDFTPASLLSPEASEESTKSQ